MATKTSDLTAKDIMTTSLISVNGPTPCKDAIAILIDKRISGIPVLDTDGTLSGVISMYDFLKACIRFPTETEHFDIEQLQRLAQTGTLDIDSMLDAMVSDLMTRDVETCQPDTPVDDVVNTMTTKHIHRLIVVDEQNKPLGLVSSLDIGKVFKALRQEYS